MAPLYTIPKWVVESKAVGFDSLLKAYGFGLHKTPTFIGETLYYETT